MNWQPIETAPSGDVVLVWNGDFITIAAKQEIGRYKGEWLDYADTFGDLGFIDEPTHWMPLPEPPK